MEEGSAGTSYAKDVQRIEDIISAIQQKDCDIDRLLDLVTEASELLKRCRAKLAETGLKIDQTLGELQSQKEEP